MCVCACVRVCLTTVHVCVYLVARPAPFGFHTEAIIHWYMHALKSSSQYKAVWVFEADVEYSE